MRDRRSALVLLLVLLWSGTGAAFVSRLHPNADPVTGEMNGPINCHAIGSSALNYVRNVYPPGSGRLKDELKTLFLDPRGLDWSPEDDADFTALVQLIDTAATQTVKLGIVMAVEAICIDWEDGFSAFTGTATERKNAYRTNLGIPTQP